MESYEFVKVYDGNTRAFPVSLNIRSNRNVIKERAGVSYRFVSTLESRRIVYPCAIITKHMIHFRDSFKFDI